MGINHKKISIHGRIPRGYKRHPVFTHYAVSKSGQVWSIYYQRNLKGQPGIHGYIGFNLYLPSGKIKRKSRASLILETFVGPRPKDFQAAHLDGKNTNDVLSNLKWCSRAENESHKHIHGTIMNGEKNGWSKLTANDVRYIRKHFKCPGHGIKSNAQELAEKFSIHKATIFDITRRESWRHLK